MQGRYLKYRMRVVFVLAKNNSWRRIIPYIVGNNIEYDGSELEVKELTSDNLGTYACYDDKEKMIKSFKLKIMFRKV